MPELSAAQGRIASARTPTSNRDGILPQRRETDVARYAVMADLRAANIGDGGADDLRRTLGMFTDAAGSAGAAYASQQVGRYKEEAAAGVLDATTGKDPNAAMSKSSVYNDAFYGARAEAGFNKFKADLDSQMQDLIASGAGPDEIQEAFAGSVKGFVDETVSRIPSASAKAETGQRLAALAADMQVGITKAVKERTDAEFVETVQANIRSSLSEGQPVTFEAYVGTFRKSGMPPAAAKKAAMDAIAAVANDPDNPAPELIDALIDSKQADGKTPSLSPEETQRAYELLGQARNLEAAKQNRETAAATDEMYTTIYARLDAGEDVDVVELVRPFRESGKVDPSSAATIESALLSFVNSREEGDLDEDVQLDTALKASQPGLSIAARRKIWEEAAPKLGSGTKARRVFVSAMVQLNGEEEARRTAASSGGGGGGGGAGPKGRRPLDAAEDLFDAVLKPPSGTQWPDPGSIYGLYSSARTYMYGEIGKGVPPLEAAQAAIAKYSYLAQRVGKAREAGGTGGLGFVPGAAAPGRGAVSVSAADLAKYQ
ncbi:MAG: hypothetical protein ACOVT5_17890 [Armatimonadaceae bacterium]